MTDELVVAGRDTPTRAAARTKRPDIQALRAFAVMAVVLNHLWEDAVPGGFIGVDVFFVISGFLITDHLMRSIGSGHARLGTFWLRRALRLLPASLLVVTVSLVGVLVLVPRSEWNVSLDQIWASALYVQNWQLVAQSTDYFTSASSPSPVTHYWSLSVEEQFYLVWPLLMLLPWTIGPPSPAARRRRVVATLGIVLVASWSFGVWRSGGHPETYFSTFARAWEFGAGGLLALGAAAVATRVGGHGRALALVAWLVLFANAFLITSDQPFPGWLATVPVLATVAIIAAGCGAGRPAPTGPLSANPAVQVLGDISYSLYLWHWPLVILTPFVIGADLGFTGRVLVLVASLALAAVTKRWVEDPVRRLSGAPLRRRAAAVGLIAGATAAIVATCLLASASVASDRAEAAAQLERLSSTRCFGAAASAPGADCPDSHTLAVGGAELMTAASQGNPVHGGTTCQQEPDQSSVLVCGFGADPADAEKTLVLTGDSHAGHWVQALDELALRHDWRVEMYVRSSCPAVLGDGIAPEWLIDSVESCGTWRAAAVAEIADRRDVDAVVTSAISREYHHYEDGVAVEQDLAPDFRAAWTTWLKAGKAVVAINDVPQMGLGDIPPCIEQAGPEDPCTSPVGVALGVPDPIRTAAGGLEGRTGFVSFDPIPFLCDEELCHSITGGIPVFADSAHMTNAFSRSFAPYLGEALRRALGD